MSVASVIVQYGTQQSRFELPSKSIPIGSLMLDFFKSKGLDEYVELEDFAVRLLVGEVFFNPNQPVSDFLDCAWAFREDETDDLIDILLIVRKTDVGDAAQRQALRIDQNEPALFSGYLWKKGGSAMTPYKRRWFCLQGATLYYQEDETSANTLGYIPMGGCEVKVRPGSSNRNFSHAFELTAGTAGKRDYALGAESEEDLARFTQAVDLFNFRRSKSIIVAALMELRRRGFATMSGIFRISGDKSAIDTIKAAYDKTEFPRLEEIKDDNVLAGIVKLTLRDMRYPLVPFVRYQDFVNVGRAMEADRVAAAKEALSHLPYVNLVFLKYLCTLFKEVASFESSTQMTPKNLAIVLAPNIVRMESESAQTMTDANYILNCVETMIMHHEAIFPELRGPVSLVAEQPPPPPPLPQANHINVGVNLFAGITKEAAAAGVSLLKPATRTAPPPPTTTATATITAPATAAAPAPLATTTAPPVASPSAPISVSAEITPETVQPSAPTPTAQAVQPTPPTTAPSPTAVPLTPVPPGALSTSLSLARPSPPSQPQPPAQPPTPPPTQVQCDLKQPQPPAASVAVTPTAPKTLPVVSQETLALAATACESISSLLTSALASHNTLAKDLRNMASTFATLPPSAAEELASNSALQSTLATILAQAKTLTAALNGSATSLSTPDSNGSIPAVVIEAVMSDFRARTSATSPPAAQLPATAPPRRPLPTLPASLPPLPTRPLPSPVAVTTPAPATKLVGTAIALFDYQGGVRMGDVAFTKGSQLYISWKEPTEDASSAGWYKAFVQNPDTAAPGTLSTYWIPANYVQMN